MDSTLCLFGFVAVQALCVVMLRVGRMAGSLSLRLGLETAALRLRFLVLATAQASLCAYPAHFLLSCCGGCATDDNSSDFAETQPARWAFLGFRHPLRSLSPCSRVLRRFYYIMPMPPMSGMAGAGAAGAGLSATRDSVVSRVAAMEAAFCRAERVTLVGSTIPAVIMST